VDEIIPQLVIGVSMIIQQETGIQQLDEMHDPILIYFDDRYLEISLDGQIPTYDIGLLHIQVDTIIQVLLVHFLS